jgi:hypothetical protein
MMAPGLLALAFYRRWPGPREIALGLVPTVAASALLGFYLPVGTIGRVASVALAVAEGVLLYGAILAYFYVRHVRRSQGSGPTPGANP